MAITAEQIVEETKHWPADAVADLIERLAVARHGGLAASREEAWANAAERRAGELDKDPSSLVLAEAARERLRRIVGR